MRKLSEKTPEGLKKFDEFKKRLKDIVSTNWLEVSEFEQQWSDIMADYVLTRGNRFTSLYDIRHYWIPSYFRDLPMSGICRTPSISESVSKFFGHYLNSKSNLVEFVMHFESAMETQRHKNDILNSGDSLVVPYLKTPLQPEKHAASIYTTKIFIKVQEEIENSCFRCFIKSIKETDEGMVYEVGDGSKDNFFVKYRRSDDNIVCKCNKFLRDGLLCSHIFLRLKHMNMDRIPDKYIVSRWTKMAYSKPLHGVGDSSLVGCVDLDEKKKMLNNIISLFYGCVGLLDGDVDKMQKLMNGLVELKDVLSSGNLQSSSKNGLFEMFYGIEKPTEISVHPPHPVKSVATERAKKRARLCRKCNTYGHHDSRNCPN